MAGETGAVVATAVFSLFKVPTPSQWTGVMTGNALFNVEGGRIAVALPEVAVSARAEGDLEPLYRVEILTLRR